MDHKALKPNRDGIINWLPAFCVKKRGRNTLLQGRERSRGKHLDTIGSIEMLQVTQPPHIAGPL